MKEKLAKICKTVFTLGESLMMICSLLALLAYIGAFIVGGETAVQIDTLIYTKLFPAMFFLVVAFAFVGAIYLYLIGYRTFRFETKRKESDEGGRDAGK